MLTPLRRQRSKQPQNITLHVTYRFQRKKFALLLWNLAHISLTKNPNFASPGLGQTDFICLRRWCKRKWKKAPCNIHAGPPGNKIQDNGVWVRETLVPILTRGSNQRIKKTKGIWWNIIHAHSLVSGVLKKIAETTGKLNMD